MKKNRLLFIAILLMTALVLTSCTNHKIQETTIALKQGNVKPFTLSLRHTQIKETTKRRLKMLEDVVAATEKAVPGLTIDLEGIDENINRDEKLRAEMVVGNPPQIFDMFGGKADAFAFAKAQRLLDLTPILKELGIQNKFVDLSEFTLDGKIYGLPMAGYVEGVYYNKAIFAELGVQIPKTYEEFLYICDKAKAKGITPISLASSDAWVINMQMNTMFVRTAGVHVQEGFVAGTAKWTDPAVLDAFRKYEELIKKGYFQAGNLGMKYEEQHDKFISGKAAMMFDGSWANSALINTKDAKMEYDIGFFNFPDMGGYGDGFINGSYSDGYGFSANLTSQQKGAVKEFIKQMYNEDMQKRQLVEEGILPSMVIVDKRGMGEIVTEMLAATQNSKGTFAAYDAIVQKKVKEQLELGMQLLLGGRTTAEQLTTALQSVQDQANLEKK
ncbi:MAG: extracellular solute-binding protein family 1 [Bacilli bacterium]|nr:extracellular solute-binding protein family 1 [Bacilli bacterium]